MPDISLCPGHKCTAKDYCWRFIAPPSHRQSYFTEPPGRDSMCEWYWKATKEQRLDYVQRSMNSSVESSDS